MVKTIFEQFLRKNLRKKTVQQKYWQLSGTVRELSSRASNLAKNSAFIDVLSLESTFSPIPFPW